MTGIIIAAGRGARMRPYTTEVPKCMLPVKGRPILAYAIERLRAAGCTRVVVVTGHLADRIQAPGCTLVNNPDPDGTNILHSLMCARDWFGDDLLLTYSDIIVEPIVYQELAAAPGDIALAVDVDWREYYVGRTQHGIEEAEKVVFSVHPGSSVPLLATGKHLAVETNEGRAVGEFTGLWKMSRAGAARFRDRFDELAQVLDATSPFQAAREWRKAYVTDLFSDLLGRQVQINCWKISRSWAEIDSVQDYERLPSMLETQRLHSLLERDLAQS